jgi:hypothetical protein
MLILKHLMFPVNSQNVDGCWTWGKDKLKNNIEIVVGKKASTEAWRIHRKDYLHDNDGNASLTKAKALWTESNINNENGKEHNPRQLCRFCYNSTCRSRLKQRR